VEQIPQAISVGVRDGGVSDFAYGVGSGMGDDFEDIGFYAETQKTIIENYKRNFIDGGNITTNSLDADRIKASTIDVAVDVGTGSGSSYVRLDGGNNRIVVHDGTNPRIVIGDV